MKAKVIATREDLPVLAGLYSGKIGEIVSAPEGRDVEGVYWLEFANTKIAWFHESEIEILPNEPDDILPQDDCFVKDILIPVGEYNGVDSPDTIVDENYIVWQSLPKATCA